MAVLLNAMNASKCRKCLVFVTFAYNNNNSNIINLSKPVLKKPGKLFNDCLRSIQLVVTIAIMIIKFLFVRQKQLVEKSS